MTSIQQRQMITLFASILFTCAGAAVEAQDGAWSSYVPPPAPRYDHVAIYDPNQDRLVIFGGQNGSTVFLDACSMPLGGAPTWAPLVPSGSPLLVNYGVKGVYDSDGARLVMTAANGNDWTWFISLAGSPAWSRVVPAGTFPPVPSDFTLIYDPVRDRVLLFGGLPLGQTQPTSNVWELTLGATPTWTQLGTVGTPPPGRRRHCAIYDSPRDRMVVFGGDNGLGTQFNDVWALSFSGPTPAWTQISPGATSPPSTRIFSAGIFDPVRDRMVIFGGQHVNSATSDTWALDLDTGEWAQLSPSSPPPGRYRHTAIYDPVRDQMVVHGGEDSFQRPIADTFFLTWGTPLGVQDRWTNGVQPSVMSAPNPSIDGANLRFSLSEAGVVNLSIVDADGRMVRAFPARGFPAGENTVPWDGRRNDGGLAASGVYFVRVEAQGMTREGKIVLAR